MPYIGNNHIAGDHTNNFKVLDDISSFTATFDGSATSVVDTTNNTIRVVEHRFIQGQRVTYTNGSGGNIGGLTTGTAYFVIFDSASTIKLATTASNAASNTAINLSTVGSGSSHTLNAAFDGVNTKFKLTHGSGTDARLNNATQINVAINNVVQRPNLDPNNFTDGFALEDNHKIVFQTAPTSEDIFWGSIIANTLTTFDISDHKIDTFTGDGSTTEFTLSHTPANNESLMVTINGVLQHPSNASTARAYTLIASIIQFTAAPANGDEIQVRHMGFAGATTADVSGFYGRTGNVVLTSNDNITTGNINAGIVTATTFDGAFSGNIVGNTATFLGNVSVGGVLTYEDVTNVDSVGIITARQGIRVPDGGSSSNRISVGDSEDLKIYHTGNESVIKQSGTGDLIIDALASGADIRLRSEAQFQVQVGGNTHIQVYKDGGVSFSQAGTGAGKKLETLSSGARVTGTLDVTSGITLDDSITHSGDTNTKIRFPAADTITAETGGSERLRINSDRVIIGQDLSNNQPTYNTSTTFVTTHTNNAGAWNAIAIISGNSTGASFLKFGDRDDEDVSQIGHYNVDNSLRFYTNGGNERLSITSAGLVGINRTSPNHTLEVGGNIYITANTSTANEGAGLLFQAKTGGFNSTSNAAIKGLRVNDTSAYLTFETGGTTERLRITSGGDTELRNTVSVITDSYSQYLKFRTTQTNGQSAVTGQIAAQGKSSWGGDLVFFSKPANGSPNDTLTERLRITSDGNITFGTQGSGGTAVNSSPIKYISGGRDYWNGMKGDYRALRLRVYDNGGNIDDQYGIGVSNGQLEIQSQGSIGFYANGAGSGTGKRVHAMTIDNQRRFSIGSDSVRTNFFNATSTHVPRLQIESTNNDNGRAAIGLVYGKANDSGPYITLAKHRSNTVGANTVVQQNDETGIISFQGSDGSEFLESARIQAFVDGTPGSNDMPGRLVFRTTPDGSAATIERVRITSTGAVTISGNINQIAPTTYDDLTGTNQAGLLIGSSGITDAGIMLRTGASGAGRIYFGDNSGSDAGRKQGQIIYHNNGDYMSFAANGSERFRITSDGSSYFGPQIITETNLRWGHDANQRPYVFSGATGSNPADATIIAANPNTDPSGTRLGGFGFGCVTSSASGVSNSGLKAVIEGVTNTNVSDAWKTGAKIRFLVRPNNGNLGEVFACNSDGTIDQIANLTSNDSILRLKNARTRASGNKYGIEFRDNINECNANIVIQQNSSGNNAGHMDFYINGGTGGNGLENGNHNLRLKQGGDVAIPTGGIEFRTLGNSLPQAAPAFINMGGTHSNAAGNGTNLNAKLKVWSDGTDMMGLSVSSNQFDYIVTQEDYDHVWYGGNSGTTEHMRLEGGGNLTLTNGNKVKINAAAAAGDLALLNMGYDGGNNIETRAIDIKGGWSTGESKSITFTHATGSTQMVGQINSVHYGGTPSRTSPHSGLRFGKLYHTTDSSTYTMTLDSTGLQSADLNLKGAYRSTKHPAFSAASSGNNSNLGSLTKMNYIISGTGAANNDGYDTTNNRFVAPVDGFYHFYARHWFTTGKTGTAWLYFFRNGSQVKECRLNITSTTSEYNTMQLSTTLYLSATNYIEVYAQGSGSDQFHPSGGTFHTEFSGFLVC